MCGVLFINSKRNNLNIDVSGTEGNIDPVVLNNLYDEMGNNEKKLRYIYSFIK